MHQEIDPLIASAHQIIRELISSTARARQNYAIFNYDIQSYNDTIDRLKFTSQILRNYDSYQPTRLQEQNLNNLCQAYINERRCNRTLNAIPLVLGISANIVLPLLAIEDVFGKINQTEKIVIGAIATIIFLGIVHQTYSCYKNREETLDDKLVAVMDKIHAQLNPSGALWPRFFNTRISLYRNSLVRITPSENAPSMDV